MYAVVAAGVDAISVAKQNESGDGHASEDARVEELKDDGDNYYRNIF